MQLGAGATWSRILEEPHVCQVRVVNLYAVSGLTGASGYRCKRLPAGAILDPGVRKADLWMSCKGKEAV